MAATKKHTIPSGVLRYQEEYGCNRAEYITTIENEDIYSLSKVDDNGFPVPLGLPLFVLVKGDDCRVVDGEDGLELSRTLFADE